MKAMSEYDQGLLYKMNCIMLFVFYFIFNIIGKLTSKFAGGKKKKGASVFDSQFTDVSKSGVKKYRYE